MKRMDMLDADIFKTVEIKGDQYRIQKFTARDGLKLARLVLAKAAPIIPMLGNIESADDSGLYKAIGEVLENLDEKDMDLLMDKCLRVCSKILPAGPQPIIDENGFYGIPELEYDMGLTLRLIVEAIRWGAADFFGENGLDLSNLMGQAGK